MFAGVVERAVKAKEVSFADIYISELASVVADCA